MLKEKHLDILCQEDLVHKVTKVHQVREDLWVHQALRETKAIKVHQVLQVNKDH